MKFTKTIFIMAFAAMAVVSCDDSKKKEAEEKIQMEAQMAEEKAMMEKQAMEEEAMMKKEAMDNSIAAKATATESLSTLVAALEAADLAGMMMEPGNYTVFAPTNTAFEKLPKGTVDNLLKPENKEQLTSVLQYHVVSGNITADKLTEAIKNNNGMYSFETVNGGTLTASIDGTTIVVKDARGKKATVVQGNVMASNGVVHIIDTVLMNK